MAGDGKLRELRQAAENLVSGMSKQQLPDVVEVSNGEVHVGTIVADEAADLRNSPVAAVLPHTDSNQCVSPLDRIRNRLRRGRGLRGGAEGSGNLCD